MRRPAPAPPPTDAVECGDNIEQALHAGDGKAALNLAVHALQAAAARRRKPPPAGPPIDGDMRIGPKAFLATDAILAGYVLALADAVASGDLLYDEGALGRWPDRRAGFWLSFNKIRRGRETPDVGVGHP